jgi:hypothetical protein
MVSRQPACGPRLGKRLEEHDALGEVGDRFEAARRGPVRARVDQHQVIAYPPGRQPRLAGPPPGDQERRRCAREIVPTGLERARPEAEPLGRQQDAPDRERTAAGAAARISAIANGRSSARQISAKARIRLSRTGSLVTEGLRARRVGTRRASDSARARSHRTNLLMVA